MVFAHLALSCATPDHPDMPAWAPLPISDLKSVAGAWDGILTSRVGMRRDDWLQLRIAEDGTYEFATYRPIGVLSGKGTFTVDNGKLVIETERGRITCSLYQANDRRMLKTEATSKDGATYSAELAPVRR